MRILLAEDEIHAGEYLVKGLGENGLLVDWVRNGLDVIPQTASIDYDLVILDVGLPGLDGWEVLRRLRPAQTMPVLFLTARDRVEDRVKGLELGADDYLIKPFAFSELLARVHVQLRRGKQQELEVLSLADLEVHLLRRRVERSGQRIDLTAKEYALLLLFLRRKGEVLSRTLIAEQVWDMNFDSDTNVVEVAIRRLRAKIDEPFDTPLLHTVRGFGYIMEQRP
ncbi:heavy metal response regulator transcription factor [Chitinimonas viridis]|uniref:Heavy metal response regulator transcription factor n=1 Tax=Chitinimonas viridis TaxID=664880 RepID=A0ABT8BBR2_9NEIS|nr:heavy metal response regulator transcription factor [Chitinimonas viridis]MDN3578996.1 heavy metal response regulator transcription factor [Chitinimonas viridis]